MYEKTGLFPAPCRRSFPRSLSSGCGTSALSPAAHRPSRSSELGGGLCVGDQRYATQVLADSVGEVLSRHPYQYSDFATLLYDDSGNVTAVETMTEQVNRLQSAMLQSVQEHLTRCRDAELTVSLGTATGVWLFAGKGPEISVRLMPIGTASVKLVSELASAGINQTCHTIRAEVTAEMQAAIPFSRTTAEVTYTCLLSETVIVGTVPESYLEFDGTTQAERETEKTQEKR